MRADDGGGGEGVRCRFLGGGAEDSYRDGVDVFPALFKALVESEAAGLWKDSD